MRTIPIPYAVGSNIAWNTSKPCAFVWVPELDQVFIMSSKPSCRKIVKCVVKKCSKEIMWQLYSSKESNFWMKVAWTFYSMQCWCLVFSCFRTKPILKHQNFSEDGNSGRGTGERLLFLWLYVVIGVLLCTCAKATVYFWIYTNSAIMKNNSIKVCFLCSYLLQ